MQVVSRSLQILSAMNAAPGPHNVLELNRRTGISRQAIYRILDTLSELGYVRTEADGFQLTHLVRTLSRGFDEESWVNEIASPVMRDLQREIVWPTDLATHLNTAMYLRETTRRFSPWTIDRAAVGLRLPMLTSATGQAYLSFCSLGERTAIVASLARSSAPEDAAARDRRYVEKIIRETRRKGYGERHGGLIPETSAIAVWVNHVRHGNTSNPDRHPGALDYTGNNLCANAPSNGSLFNHDESSSPTSRS